MQPVLVLVVALLACVPLGLAALTASGSRRRGAGPWSAAIGGVFFPVTWVIWYVRDAQGSEHQGGAASR
jgi:hypothetical protein